MPSKKKPKFRELHPGLKALSPQPVASPASEALLNRFPGRPRNPNLDRRITINLSLPTSLVKKLDQASAKTGIPISRIAEKSLEKELN